MQTCAVSHHFADLHLRIKHVRYNAYLHMYGTLRFLALITNSQVFIYIGQFLPAFGRSQQSLDYRTITGL